MSRKTRHCRCPKCGGTFFTENATKTYCGEQCRKAAENLRRRDRMKKGSS